MLDLIQPYLVTVVQSLIGVLVLFILAGIAVIRRKTELWLQSKTTESQRQTIYHLASEAFSYAESVFRSSNGPQKLDAAYAYLSSRLKDAGISIGGTEIRAAIEKSVLEYNAKTKPPVSDPPNSEPSPLPQHVQQLVDAAASYALQEQATQARVETP